MGSSDEAATGESTAANQESNTSVTDNAINAEANQEEGTSSDDGTQFWWRHRATERDTSGDGIGTPSFASTTKKRGTVIPDTLRMGCRVWRGTFFVRRENR